MRSSHSTNPQPNVADAALTYWNARLKRLRHSVRVKLTAVVVGTTTIALLIAGVAMLSHDLAVYRTSWTADLSTQARILALSTTPAIFFDDRETAARNLGALQARAEVLAAAIYTRRGALYAAYVREGSVQPPRTLSQPASRTTIHGERIQLIQPIYARGEWIGTIYLTARYDVRGRIVAYVGIFGLVTLVGVLVALLLSTLLQRVITRPLEAIAGVARQVIEHEDYSPRAVSTQDPEIGVVVEAFNRMMDEVQHRTLALQSEVQARQAAEEKLARANARLESTMAAAEIGSWVWDLRTGTVTGDKNLAALYGLPTEQLVSSPIEVIRTRIHAQDRPAVAAAEQEALRTGILASTDFRLVRTDGSIRWVAARGKVQFNSEGQPTLLAGLLIDLTAQKTAEAALRQSERLYRAIGESIHYGVWVTDAQGRMQYVSESFQDLTGVTPEQWAREGWAACVHPEETVKTLAAWRLCLESGGVWYRELRVRGVDGQYHAVLSQGVPIHAEDGQINGWAGLNLDIAQLKRTEEALREADRRKDEFLATLAHELRNPLAPIRHAAKILELPTADERQRQWGRDVISRQVQRMALLLDDLLDVSRITRGRLQLRRTRVELSTLVAAAVETARPLIEAKQHTLKVSLPKEPVELEVDPLRISQSLSNLLTNAAKYTDARGSISLTASIDDAGLTLDVDDNGVGLSSQTLPKLFQMFSQVDSAVDRTEGGLGIGLALVKGLIQLHGGTVAATSAGLGRGSRFTIRLPVSCLAPRQVREEPTAAKAQPAKVPSLRVLLADDNADAVESLSMLLRMTGYEAHTTYSGAAALEVAARLHPEVYILDIGMSGMNGYEIARRIRQETWGRDALLVAITGWGQQEDKEHSRRAGFDYHLTKPVEPDELTELLRSYAHRRNHERHPSGHVRKC